MQDRITEAIVLDREEYGDLDYRITLYSKRYGKLRPKAKSARKATSKLAGHLIQGNVVSVRLIEKNGLQVVDALQLAKVRIVPPDLHLLGQLLAEEDPDLRLWHTLYSVPFHWPTVLRLLGWDPNEAVCTTCGTRVVASFAIASQQFYCIQCRGTSKNEAAGVSYLHLSSH